MSPLRSPRLKNSKLEAIQRHLREALTHLNFMGSLRASSFACILLSFAVVTAAAQLPVDNGVWRDRCNLLASQSHATLSGATPALLITATRGIPADKFYAMAVNRAQAGDHYVACTMYSLAAISARAGNGGTHDYTTANNDVILAAAELRLAHHQHLLMAQHLKRVEMKIDALGTTLSLNANESGQVIAAASTTPITLAPPTAFERSLNAPSK
jgi:hypothetical protein